MRQRLLAIVIVVVLAAGGTRLAMAPTPVTGYRALDDYNLALQIIGSRAQWRGVTVDETDAAVTIDLKEIWVHGPGFDDDIAYFAVRLTEPLGTRNVINAATGMRVPALAP
jgi:hypothetical protein